MNGGTFFVLLVNFKLMLRVTVPGLLVTGRSGSGKTSVLRAVAKAMQENPQTLACMSLLRVSQQELTVLTDTLYADVAKFADTPVSKVKAQIKYWFEKAAWHWPSLIVLDNLDKLMGVELEV